MENSCDHCRSTDYRYAKAKDLLCWLIHHLQSVNGNGITDAIRKNCELDSWWRDNERAYQIKLQREKEEKEKEQKIKDALAKLTAEERLLLKV